MGFYSNVCGILCSPGPRGFCPAKAMGARATQRQDLAVQALVKSVPITRLAAEHSASRKFVSRQRDRADEAIHAAFSVEDLPADTILGGQNVGLVVRGNGFAEGFADQHGDQLLDARGQNFRPKRGF
jgi:hypothetical protein